MKVSDVCIRKKSILLIGVEQGEVLHNDGHQQVERNVGDDDIEGAEKQNCPVKVATGGFPIVVFLVIGASWRFLHTVMKDSVPVFAGDDPEEEQHSPSGRLKVGLSVVLQKLASELHPKARNHGEGPY